MFLFWLAKELGMTVKMLLANVTAYEIAEWKGYFLAQEDIREGKDTDKTLQMKIVSAFTRKNEVQ